MLLLIDGYNVMKMIFSGKGEVFFREKKIFIASIGSYFSYKRDTINEVIICFDGGPELHKTREVKKGVVVLHSGQRMSADDLIVEQVEKHKNVETALVTNDRQLVNRALRIEKQVVQVESEAFWELVSGTLAAHAQKKDEYQTFYQGNIKKIDTEESALFDDQEMKQYQSTELDALMLQAGLQSVDKDTTKENEDLLKKKGRRGTISSIIKKM